MMTFVCIDPGTDRSGVVRFLHGQLLEAGTYPNQQVLALIHRGQTIIIEWLQCYGSAVGQSILRTAQFTGEVKERCLELMCEYHEMTRPEVCRVLIGKTKGTSKATIRRAVMDLYPRSGAGSNPEIGTKTNPGPLFKMRGTDHAWDALALFEAWKKVQI